MGHVFPRPHGSLDRTDRRLRSTARKRPNVGKSTLLNQILGQTVAIVTPKPQTTRSRILAIKTLPDAQLAFIDTPGLHRAKNLINRHMVETAERAVAEADVVLWVIDATEGLTPADREIGERLATEKRPVCVALNKIDRVARVALLPILTQLAELLPERDLVPVSALEGGNLDTLLRQLVLAVPPGPQYFDPETFTDQTERVIVQEAVREQVLLQTRHEVPYAVAVTVDTFEEKGRLAVISATIHVERDSQKGIIIGARGG